MAERLRRHSREQKVPSSSLAWTSVLRWHRNANLHRLYVFNVVCASRLAICIHVFFYIRNTLFASAWMFLNLEAIFFKISKTTPMDYTLKTLFRQSPINLLLSFFIFFNISRVSSQQETCNLSLVFLIKMFLLKKTTCNSPRQLVVQWYVLCSFVKCGTSKQIEGKKREKQIFYIWVYVIEAICFIGF